ncbi:uncharacterized protein LOC114157637 [Xiphophorus couchianus]|uniref:uncharacterized protein LOC114157637 n=1 Tax=Xiphophorus couchianus TaxID=32473 RepID=UPI00101669E4|nr:uncharacterized protein LOC114157637 [Xiphophorus couchianus]
MRGRLAEYQEEAEKNLLQAQQKQKRWYDQQTRQRVLSPGQKVLLLLPSSISKLLAKWQGPYTISRQLGPTTYEVYHPDKKKATQAYHVNLLKEWKELSCPAPETSCLLRPVEEEEEIPGIEVMVEQSTPNLSHLTSHQASQLQQIFQKLSPLFSPNPGRTSLIEHAIRLKEKQPIRQRPYRVPQQLVGQLRDEVETMLTSERLMQFQSLMPIPCPGWMSCWKGLEKPSSLPLWTCVKGTGRFHWSLQADSTQHFVPLLVFSNLLLCHLACMVLQPPSSG